MAIIKSVNKALDTRLVQAFGGRLKDWADELQKCPDTIVAISRKGPRLIELMAHEGFLSENVLPRVIAEQALPFLTQNDNAGFVVVDDVITYGTTFNNVYDLTKQANIRCGGNNQKPMGIPFAVGQKANEEYRKKTNKYFLDLKSDQIASFVNNEMLAFRLLGKPYDIEHPMLTWIGDFTDTIELDTALKQITKLLGGQIFNIDTSVPIKTGNVTVRRWTILLPANSSYNLYPHADFRKLRIYLNPEKNRLLVAAMCPVSLSKDDMYSLGKILPVPLNHLWNEVAGKVKTDAEGHMADAGSRSLAMWANFLLAMVLLRDIKANFIEVFETAMLQSRMVGPRREDLQYLIGPALCSHAEFSLAQFLESVDSTSVSYPLFAHVAEIMGERVPSDYEERYMEKRSSLVDKALDVNDVLQAIFYAQHADIELPSREKNKNNKDNSERLEFGITYSKIRQMVLDRFPDTAEIDIHKCLDQFIDNGAIVPRYIDMAPLGKTSIWARTFRVGEGQGTVKQIGQTVRLLFDKLSRELKKPDLPPLLFEKFCVLAICVATDIDALRPLQSLGISKLFHLYGARASVMLTSQKNQEFLTEWAVNRNILRHHEGDTGTETSGSYSLSQNINLSYPSDECPWVESVKNYIEDLATLVAAIHTKCNDDVLVALTSTASEQELQHALEAELRLWLYDHSASVHHGLDNLSLLTKENISLDGINIVLSKTANFTAQVEKKVNLAKRRQEIYSEIDKLVGEDKLMSRCWNDLRTTLNGRVNSEQTSPGLQEITSTLRIAHVTTRVLRELLTLAGFKDKLSRSIGLEKSLDRLQATLDDPEMIDLVTRDMFGATDTKPDIKTLITTAKSQPLDNFKEAFPDVRRLILEIATRCEQVLNVHGIDKRNEQPDVLSLPHYIMMWDIIGSTKEKNRDKIEVLIVDANRRIKDTIGNRIKGFDADSKDDGNNFICEKFKDVLDAFQILNEVFQDYQFRAGCEVNLLGSLNYYPESKSLGGRAFDYAARVIAFYKEMNADPVRWSHNPGPTEPATSYMVVSEFAKRYAQEEKTWPENGKYIINELDGEYKARVNGSLPVSLTILQSAASRPKNLESTEVITRNTDSLDLFHSL